MDMGDMLLGRVSAVLSLYSLSFFKCLNTSCFSAHGVLWYFASTNTGGSLGSSDYSLENQTIMAR